MALVIECKDHYNAVLDFAIKNHAEAQLRSRLARLEQMCNEPLTRCYLHKDFAPYSFAFMLETPGSQRRPIVGGLIYNGPGQPGDGSGPAYSVNIDPPADLHSWSIHT